VFITPSNSLAHGAIEAYFVARDFHWFILNFILAGFADLWRLSTLDSMKSNPHYSNSKWLHIVIPGNLWADIYGCEWLLYIGPLRCACRECWNMPVQEWFAQWMNKHEASCFKEAEHTDLESLFWFFRCSYTQRCFLRLIYLASSWKCSPEGKSTSLLH